MNYICPLITVADINRSKHFYTEILEQKIKYDFGENVTFHGDFAIHLQSHFSTLIDNKPILPGGNNFELYFENDHPEAIVVRLKKYGTNFVHEIKEQPWRQKVLRFYDPDQNLIEIGESMEYLCFRLSNESLSIEQIAQITGLPKDFVDKSIASFN